MQQEVKLHRFSSVEMRMARGEQMMISYASVPRVRMRLQIMTIAIKIISMLMNSCAPTSFIIGYDPPLSFRGRNASLMLGSFAFSSLFVRFRYDSLSWLDLYLLRPHLDYHSLGSLRPAKSEEPSILWPRNQAKAATSTKLKTRHPLDNPSSCF